MLGGRGVCVDYPWRNPGSLPLLPSTRRAAGDLQYRLVWLHREAGYSAPHRNIEVLFSAGFFALLVVLGRPGRFLARWNHCAAVRTEVGDFARCGFLFHASGFLLATERDDCSKFASGRPLPCALCCSWNHADGGSTPREFEIRCLRFCRNAAGCQFRLGSLRCAASQVAESSGVFFAEIW